MKFRRPTEQDFRTILEGAKQESESGERESFKQQTHEAEKEIMEATEEGSFVPGQYVTFEEDGRKEYDWIFLGSEKAGSNHPRVKIVKDQEIRNVDWQQFDKMQENIGIDAKAVEMAIGVLNEKLNKLSVDLENNKKTMGNAEELVFARYRVGELAGLLEFKED